MIKEITVPDIGEKVESGSVVSLLVSVGDVIKVDQPVIEVETEKAVVEIPSPYGGKITEVAVAEGDELKIGSVIARIETDADTTVEKKEPEKKPDTPKKKEAAGQSPKQPAPKEKEQAPAKTQEEKPADERKKKAPAEEPRPSAKGKREEDVPEPMSRPEGAIAPASPSVRRLARELGVDINKISGSGPGNRITMEDVQAYTKQLITGGRGGFSTGAVISKDLPDFSEWGTVRKSKMSRVREIIAESTAFSWETIPHVTQFDKADITDLETFRRKYARKVESRGGKLTVTAILVKIICEALKTFPKFNASIDVTNKEIIYKEYYNIQIAVDTDRGLLMPVIRDADQKGLTQVAVELKELAEKTRNKKISPEEMEGGTFTISNQGGIGGTDFTPIIYWPQVAILGVSQSAILPVWKDDSFQPRTVLPLSLSYDHRLIDGAEAARFLRWVVEVLQDPLTMFFED